MRDSHTFKTYLKISRMIGLCPWNKTTSRISDLLSKVHLSVFISLFITTNVMAIVSKIQSTDVHLYPFSLRVVDFLEGVLGMIFMLSVFTKCVFSSTNWDSALTVILKDDELDLHHCRYKYISSLKIMVIQAVTLCIFVFEMYTWFGVADNGRSAIIVISFYISFGMRIYCQFVLVILIWELSSILESRYDQLKTKIQNTFLMNSGRIVSSKHLKLRIREIKSEYADLYRALVYVSRFFGTTIWLFLACTMIALLNSCSWGLYYGCAAKFEEYGIGALVTSVVVSPLYNLSLTTFLVMACDKVERSGEDLVNACFFLQEGMDKSDISDELTFLIQHLQALMPKFSVAGLFCVNRRVLSTLMTITTSYVIVILQFKD